MKSLISLLKKSQFKIRGEFYSVGNIVYNRWGIPIKFLDYDADTDMIQYRIEDRISYADSSNWVELFRKSPI